MNADNGEITSHIHQAREFLAKGHDYLTDGDLHQTSEKGWGAAAHMAKAVTLAQGWQYERHSHFHRVMNRARELSASDRLRFLHGRAEVLHANLYELGHDLNGEVIREDLTSIRELLDLLEPLTEAR